METELKSIKSAVILFGIVIVILLGVIAYFQYDTNKATREMNTREFMDKVREMP